MTSNLVLTNWTSPYNEIPLTALDIKVPPGKWLEAEYVLNVSSVNGGWGIGFKNRGFTTGDYIGGYIEVPNYNPASGASGGNYYKLLLNNTFFDTDPGTTRNIDIAFGPSSETRIFIKVRYKNNSTSTVTFGYDYGADIHVAYTGLNLTVQAGSSVVYTLLGN